jgi:HlyD family secretion protein
MSKKPFNAGRSIRRHALVGTALIALLVGGVGGWAATTELSGAVIAGGQLVVDSSVKKVQHPTGGVVGELRVRDGSRVAAGDILLRLDDTQTKASLAIVTKALDENMARRGRLEAERDDAPAIVWPPDLLARKDLGEAGLAMAGEQRLFETRRSARRGQKAQLAERVSQLREQIAGFDAQVEAKKSEINWVRQELEGVRDLYRKNLVQFPRVTALERDAAKLDGDRGSLMPPSPRRKAASPRPSCKSFRSTRTCATRSARSLSISATRPSELFERRIAAEDLLKRIDIRAPQDGTVHQLTVHTIGGVIVPQGEPIMLIVPYADALTVEVRVQPQDIDQIHVGQAAVLRFPAFNQQTTPEIDGKVSLVSADVSTDLKSGMSFYTVRVAIPDEGLTRLQGLRLVPGMPVEAFVQTAPRTVVSYLIRPISDQMTRAFREK